MAKDKKDAPFQLMTEQERKEFQAFLAKTAQRVEKWPEWKRQALSDPAPTEDDEEPGPEAKG